MIIHLYQKQRKTGFLLKIGEMIVPEEMQKSDTISFPQVEPICFYSQLNDQTAKTLSEIRYVKVPHTDMYVADVD